MTESREELLPTKMGALTVRHRGILLHSSYDPWREAETFIRSQNILSFPSVFVAIGSCLGYLESLLRRQYPGAKIISLQFSPFYRNKRVEPEGTTPCWYPDMETGVRDFLYQHIREIDFSDLCLLSWKPAVQAYAPQSERITQEILQTVREMGRSIQTTLVFGRKWILNGIKNFLFHSSAYRFVPTQHPICIAASGPSLHKGIPYLRRYRDRYILWALPSSLMVLKHEGIVPDLVIMTDAGSHASYLLSPYRREPLLPNQPVKVAMPLTASFVPPTEGLEPVFFNQGSGIERAILSYFPEEPLHAPSNGTVAGTALELALRVTRGPIFTWGLDLCTGTTLEHPRPHPFDTFLHHSASRFQGTEGPWIRRLFDLYPQALGGGVRSSPSLGTYAGWFQTQEKRWRDQVFRVFPSSVDTGMEEASPSILEGLPSLSTPPLHSFFLSPTPPLSPESRRQRIKELVRTLKESLETVDPLLAELLQRHAIQSSLDPRRRLLDALNRIDTLLGEPS